MLNDVFDPTKIPPSTGGGGKQLPISDSKGHMVIITDSEMKPTADNTGSYLALELQIIEGPHTGEGGTLRLNVNNNSADAVRIAYRDLSAICHVVGHLSPLQNVSVLYNRPFRVVVGYQKGQEEKGYTQVNMILNHLGLKAGQTGGTNSPAQHIVQQPQQAQAPSFQQAMPQQAAPQGFQQAPQQAPSPQGFPVQNIPFSQPQAPQQAFQQPAPQPQQFAGAPQQTAKPPWAQ